MCLQYNRLYKRDKWFVYVLSRRLRFFFILFSLSISQDCRHYLVCFKSWIAEEYLLDYQELLETFWKNKRLENQDLSKNNKEISEVCIFTFFIVSLNIFDHTFYMTNLSQGKFWQFFVLILSLYDAIKNCSSVTLPHRYQVNK